MSSKQRGLLITFEGIDGAGKSTLIHQIEAWLKEKNIPVTVTREPGGSQVSEMIRQILLHQNMCSLTELFLYEASRAEHTAQTIEPALKSGQVVLCDRYTDSSLAYQAAARGLNWQMVTKLNEIATQGIKPKLTIWLDVDPEISFARAQNANRFEAEGLEFQKKVQKGFLKAQKQNPKRWLRIKVQQKTPEQLAHQVIQLLEKQKWIKA